MQLIITSEHRLEPASQFLSRFQRAGFCHTLLVTLSKADCDALADLSRFGTLAQSSCGFHRDVARGGGTPNKPDWSHLTFFKIKALPPQTWWHKWYVAGGQFGTPGAASREPNGAASPHPGKT